MLNLNGFTGWVREHRFAPPRRYRFDFAFVEERLALEVEGLTGGAGGRHQRVTGFMSDCEKYLLAATHGWTVIRVPASWIKKGGRRVWKPELLEALRKFLKE